MKKEKKKRKKTFVTSIAGSLYQLPIIIGHCKVKIAVIGGIGLMTSRQRGYLVH